MKIVVDSHTHTIASGHAYSTVQEMAREAQNNGIEMFVVTDHAPAMGGAPHLYHFGNLKTVPDVLYGVKILKGVEANIIDYDGNIDMPVEYLKRLDFVLASFHDICISPSTVEEHTKAVINLFKNPFIDAIAHPGNPQFQVDIERVVKAAKEHNKFIEINNHSFFARSGSEENCKTFARVCKEMGTCIVCGSDAHISFDIGKFEKVYKILDETDMPEELVLNTSVKKFEEYVQAKKIRIRQIGL